MTKKSNNKNIYSYKAGKIYSIKQINVGVILGGPLAAGYFAVQNFKEFGNKAYAKLAWIVSILVFAVFLFFLTFFKGFPNEFLPAFYFCLSYTLVSSYQDEHIYQHLKNNGKVHNWWQVIGISLIFLAITIGLYFLANFLTK